MTLSRRGFLTGAAAATTTTLAGCGNGYDLSPTRGFNADRFAPRYRMPDVAPQPTRDYNAAAIQGALVDPQQMQIRRIPYNGFEPPRNIIVNPAAFKLYLIEDGGWATEYPIAIGRDGLDIGYSDLYIAKKATNPRWTPTASMRKRNPSLPQYIEGGLPNNPLGSHAIYFYDINTQSDTAIRAHGTKSSDRHTIGTRASSGCFRMLNEHARHLHARVHIYGEPTDPTNKARMSVVNGSIYTPGMNYQNARIIDPNVITSGPKLAHLTP